MTEPSQESPARKRSTDGSKPRPGRFRRWVVRPIVWTLALLFIFVLVVHLLLGTETVRERVRVETEAWLAKKLDRAVQIGGLSFGLLPLEVEVLDVVLPGPEADSHAVVKLERATAEITPSLVLQRRIVLRSIELVGPELFIESYETGGNNLPKWQRNPNRDGGRFDVKIGAVSVADGVVEIDHTRIELGLEAQALAGSWVATGPRSLRGSLSSREVAIVLPRARPFLGAVDVVAEVDENSLDLLGISLSGPSIDVVSNGRLEWKPELSLELSSSGSSELQLLERLGYFSGASGRVGIDGRLDWNRDSWGWRGEVRSPSLLLFDRRLNGVEAELDVAQDGARLDILRSEFVGGSLVGWVRQSFGAASVATLPPGTTIDLQLERLSLEQLLAAEGVPVSGLSGRVGGVLNYRFPNGGAEHGFGWGEFQISPEVATDESLELGGSVSLLIEDGVLLTEAVRLSSERQEILAQGRFDFSSREAVFDYSVDTADVAELLGCLPIEIEEGGLDWRPTAGRGSLEGQLRLAPASLETDLVLDLTAVRSGDFFADHTVGNLSYGATGVDPLRLEFSRPSGALLVNGRFLAPAADGTPGELSITADAVSWPVEQLKQFAGMDDIPISGRLSGALALRSQEVERAGEEVGRMDVADLADSSSGSSGAHNSGGRNSGADNPGESQAPTLLVGSLIADVEPAAFGGFAFEQSHVELELTGETVRLDRLELSTSAGTVEVNGSISLRDQTATLELAGLDLDLARLPGSSASDRSAGPLSGRFDLQGSLRGSLLEPEAEFRLDLRSLALGGRPLGDGDDAVLTGRLAAGQLDLSGGVPELLTVDGGGVVRHDAIDVELAIASDRLQSMLQLSGLEAAEEITGSLDGVVALSSSDPAVGIETEVRLSTLELGFRGRRLTSLEPVLLQVMEDTLEIESLFLGEVDSDAEIFAAGSIGLSDGFPLELQMQAIAPADWLELLLPENELRGELQVLSTVGGSLARPELNGQVGWSDGRLVGDALPASVSAIEALLLLYPDRWVLDDFRARSAGGGLRAGGAIELPEAAELSYRFQLSGDELNLRLPDGWLLRTDAEVTLSSSTEGRVVGGVLDLERVAYQRDVELGIAQLLSGVFGRHRIEVQDTDELLATTELNLAVRGPDALVIKNNLAELSGGVDLVLRGSAARPVVFGKIELDAGGTIVYSDNEYEIERGLLSFVNPERIDPVIDLVARSELQEFDLTLNLSGTFERLEANFASDPPLSDLEVLALVATGEQIDTAPVGGRESEFGAADFLYGQAATLVTERVNKLFGLDKFRVVPLTGSSGDISSARVTVGKRLSRDLFVTYSYDPSETSAQLLEVEWQIGRGLTLVMTQEADGSFAGDARWEKSF